VATVREDLGQAQEGTGEGQPAAGAARPPAPRRRRPGLAPLSALVRRHWLFSLAVAVAVLPRLVAMLGYRPAMLFRLDSFDYLWGAVHSSPNVVNPSGYSLFLWVLRPFHSLVLVTAVQHVLGLAVATMVYALLRHYRLPAWGATLAAAPVLFDPEQIMIEHLIMADLLAMVLLVGAFVVLLFRESPSLWRSATAGVMMGISTIIRPTVLPLVFLIPLYLLLRRVGWRRAGAALVAGLVPVLGYMSWFAAVHGTFNMTNSNGLFLWSRTMSFANCQVIKPPANLVALCPNSQPGPLARADPALRRQPKRYLWNHRTWQWKDVPSTGFVPDTAAFTQANNTRALQFAIKAIEAQPLAYAQTVVTETVTPFFYTDTTLRFPVTPTSSSTLDRPDLRYAIGSIEAYTGSNQGVAGDLGYHFGTRLVHPYVTIMNIYQHVIFLSGPIFALVLLVGLVGIVMPTRRSPVAILLWVSSAVIIVLPVAEHEYTYRYVIPAVPLACMAAALAFRPRRPAGNQDGGGAPVPQAVLAGPAAAPGGAAQAAPAPQAAPAAGPAASHEPVTSDAPAAPAGAAPDGPDAPPGPGQPAGAPPKTAGKAAQATQADAQT
jgi:hypothetical protein